MIFVIWCAPSTRKLDWSLALGCELLIVTWAVYSRGHRQRPYQHCPRYTTHHLHFFTRHLQPRNPSKTISTIFGLCDDCEQSTRSNTQTSFAGYHTSNVFAWSFVRRIITCARSALNRAIQQTPDARYLTNHRDLQWIAQRQRHVVNTPSVLCLNTETAIDELFQNSAHQLDEPDITNELTSVFMTTPLWDCTIHQLEHPECKL